MNLDKFFKSLPEVPGMNNRDRCFNSVVFVPFIEVDGELCILFEKRAGGIRQEHEICFPGGGFDVDLDREFRETAIRETSEELGISEDKIHIEGRLNTIIHPMEIIVEVFTGTLDIDDVSKIDFNKDEVEKLLVVPVKYFLENEPELYHIRFSAHPDVIDDDGNKKIVFPAKELGIPEKYAKPWGNRLHEVIVYRYGGETIWGMTARIVEDFLKLYRKQ